MSLPVFAPVLTFFVLLTAVRLPAAPRLFRFHVPKPPYHSEQRYCLVDLWVGLSVFAYQRVGCCSSDLLVGLVW